MTSVRVTSLVLISLQDLARWAIEVIRALQALSGNVEPNPGPNHQQRQRRSTNPVRESDIAVTSYNIRGLKDEGKMRHLLNFCHQGATSTKSDHLFLFQETYIDCAGKLPYIWRGNFFLTPGEGHSGGCLTLMSSHLDVIASREIDKRAHVLACQRKGENSIAFIVANIYAPNPNTNEKITFFEKLFELIRELEIQYRCRNVILAGDFNLTFKSTMCKNRMRTTQECRVADVVTDMLDEANLDCVWDREVHFTWRRPNTDSFSCIDHIFYSKQFLEGRTVKSNWSLSFSDHAAVEATFVCKGSEPTERSKIVRLDVSLIKTPENKLLLEKEFNEMWKHVDRSWNPHMKLDYAKLCIRTVAEKIQAERKRKERNEEEEIDEELNLAIGKLEKGVNNVVTKRRLVDYVEELRAKKDVLIEAKGKKLAEKLGTKWYNEGEKSTKYFLRLLNRNLPDKFGEIIDASGQLLKGKTEVETEIINFYKALYEDYDKSNLHQVSDEAFFNNVSPISDEDSNEVSGPITLEELTKTLRTCRDSAPGPDGIPYSYLGALWPVMGSLICEAWSHSLVTGELCPSHKTSYLKLIPKAGKDLKKLTNWRPITLSNCDHKIITKTYSIRMASKVSKVIAARQTAYLKGRLINDNIRSIVMSIRLANLDEENIDGLIVSLDAKKAFDSVEHSYIESCLKKFGLSSFVKIFKTLYSDLRSDILVNGKIVSGYRIKRGVKQGDALSCILFIMCMEPLIANIENNASIEKIFSVKLGSKLPKAFTYADDLNCVIKRTRQGLQTIFEEYSRLTRLAGLELKADKTEILRFANSIKGKAFEPMEFEVRYLTGTYRIKTVEETKINGIFFQQDETRMRTRNVAHVRKAMENQLRKWTARNLSTLGKILIAKTFGISQLVFLMQSLTLEKSDMKILNETLYRFIWNKHFQASKAPERIKREYLMTSIKNGGFGMLDIVKLDDGLKLRSFGRLLNTSHPALTLLKNKLNLDDFFFPNFDAKLDSFVARGIELLKQDRQNLLCNRNLWSDAKLISALRASKIRNVIRPQTRNNINVFMLSREGKKVVSQLNLRELGLIKNLLKENVAEELVRDAISLRVPVQGEDFRLMYHHRNRWVALSKLTSKEIRETRSSETQICLFKCGLIMGPRDGYRWLNRLNKLSSTKHKNAILRYLHGDIYSGERLFRFGLRDNPNCDICGNVETIGHKILECGYSESLWRALAGVTSTNLNLNQVDPDFVSGSQGDCTTAILTVHAELILRLTRNIRPEWDNPESYIKNMISQLERKETGKIKNELRTFI